MKTILFVLILFLSAAAFAQYGGGYLSSQPNIYQPPDHPQHAGYAPIASEQTVLGGAGYTSAQGDRPASDFPQKPQASLGEIARELRKQHQQQARKSRFVYTNM